MSKLDMKNRVQNVLWSYSCALTEISPRTQFLSFRMFKKISYTKKCCRIYPK